MWREGPKASPVSLITSQRWNRRGTAQEAIGASLEGFVFVRSLVVRVLELLLAVRFRVQPQRTSANLGVSLG